MAVWALGVGLHDRTVVVAAREGGREGQDGIIWQIRRVDSRQCARTRGMLL